MEGVAIRVRAVLRHEGVGHHHVLAAAAAQPHHVPVVLDRVVPAGDEKGSHVGRVGVAQRLSQRRRPLAPLGHAEGTARGLTGHQSVRHRVMRPTAEHPGQHLGGAGFTLDHLADRLFEQGAHQPHRRLAKTLLNGLVAHVHAQTGRRVSQLRIARFWCLHPGQHRGLAKDRSVQARRGAFDEPRLAFQGLGTARQDGLHQVTDLWYTAHRKAPLSDQPRRCYWFYHVTEAFFLLLYIILRLMRIGAIVLRPTDEPAGRAIVLREVLEL